ncbi:hypothetical protein SO802_032023 [Lithocarpus litseifolius]|uniref:Protein FAR1-RELATED SEQUENCE n=1 Tax=Lithocarpus litseifolius TaxID=425828 RepID=A0AAW2BMR7_9ROSI
MEKQVASLYTPTIFKKFRKELIGSMSVPLKRMARTDSFVTYKVTKGEKAESIVEFNSQDSTIKCSCKSFESVGILCSHALKLLNTRNIFEIPPQYILKRRAKFAKDGVKKGSVKVNDEDVRNTSSVASVDWKEKVEKDLYLNQGEASEETMEFQVQKKRKIEVRKKMNPPSSSMSLP